MKTKSSLSLILAAATLPLSSAYGHTSGTTTWSGGTSSDWTDASNWSTATAPVTGGTNAIRINVLNDTNHPLEYTSAQGTTIYNPSDRALVIGSTSPSSVNGSMIITGGTFDSRGTGADLLGNVRAGTLTIAGGNYINTNGGSDEFFVVFNGTGTLNVNSGSFTTGILHYQRINSGATGTVNLNGGVLTASSILRSGTVSSTFNFNGGQFVASDDVDFVSTINLNVRDGGAKIDTNGNSVTVSGGLKNDGTGGLEKSGGGTLTLAGENTYIGNTTITAGTLTLADTSSMRFEIGDNEVNNSILGSGTVNLDGMFEFDLTGASTNIGDFWNIVDLGNLSATFAGTFEVSSTQGAFSGNAGVWSISENNVTYQFSEATGVLTVIPEPTTALLGGLGLLALLRRRR